MSRFMALVLVVIMAYSYFHSSDLLLDRAWMDTEPAGYHDPFAIYVFRSEDFDSKNNAKFGVYYSGTPSKYTVEAMAFKYCQKGISVKWISDSSESKTEYVITQEKNGEFDLKLTLSTDPRHGNAQHVYWSKTDDEGLLKKILKH